MRFGFIGVALAAGVSCSVGSASAAIIIATGQNNGDPTHSSGNYFYQIDTTTGIATPISPAISGGTPAGLGYSFDGRLLGLNGNSVVDINPVAGTWTPVAAPNPALSLTGFELVGNFGYSVNLSGADRRLQQIDLTNNAVTPVGPNNAVGFALDSFFGDAAGTTQTFIIGMGAVTKTQTIAGQPVDTTTLYGVHLGTNRNQLVAINPDTGIASVVGSLNSVGTSGNPGAGRYSGFAAMTGVDENADGKFDALFGNVNFFDPDAGGPLPSQRLGGVARYDLTDGTWSMVGTNPGLIFFGFGSPVPEPATLSLLAGAGLLAMRRRRN